MTYEIRYETRGNYLYAHVTGEDSLDTSLAYWQDLRREIEARGLRSLLVVEELTGTVDTLGTYRVGKTVSELFLGYPIRLAFVDVTDFAPDNTEFGTTVSRNRGLNVQSFQTEAAAEAWLQQ